MDKKIADVVLKEIKKGAYLKDALKKAKISYTKWRAITQKLKIKVDIPKGKKQITYNPERVKEVQKRIKKGQFLHEITKDMGMDPNNLARYCRYNGIQLFTKAEMAANYKRRVYKGGRRKGQASRAPQVLKMLEQNKPHTVIADKLKISRQYVSHLKRQMMEKGVTFPSSKPAVKKATAKKVAPKKVAPKKAATKKTAPAKKAPSKKAPSKKVAPKKATKKKAGKKK